MDTILQIEDDAGQQHVTERLYQMFGKCFHGEVKFLSAATPQDGLTIIRHQVVDVVLLDLIFPNATPGMNWEDTLEWVRSTLGLPPVIVLTGKEDEKFLADKCILAGADDFFIKREINPHPEVLCRAAYYAFMRRQRDLRRHEARA